MIVLSKYVLVEIVPTPSIIPNSAATTPVVIATDGEASPLLQSQALIRHTCTSLSHLSSPRKSNSAQLNLLILHYKCIP